VVRIQRGRILEADEELVPQEVLWGEVRSMSGSCLLVSLERVEGHFAK
jgi:hypothetical protein